MIRETEKVNLMRSMVYIVTAVAALGIVVGIAMMPPTENSSGTATISEVATSDAVMSESGTLVMRVPDMHCVFACYPTVKSTLEANETVDSVELAEQKEEGTIDNPAVVVKYEPGFDVNAAITALAQKGFKKAEVIQ